MEKKKTSWGEVAEWYDDLLKESDTYQKAVILPNIIRLMEIKKGEIILDLACGQGFFSNAFLKNGARVTGVDISKELIALAKKNSPTGIDFHVAPADNLKFLQNNSVDKIAFILAAQNIENLHKVFKECSRVLKKEGKIFIVINHPTFRIPKESSWGWDEEKKAQYRRIDGYLSEMRSKIQMHPGGSSNEFTYSFHRPLQLYFKFLSKNEFCISRLEEWISHKKSQAGPRASAEDRARKEIPLFLVLEAIKING